MLIWGPKTPHLHHLGHNENFQIMLLVFHNRVALSLIMRFCALSLSMRFCAKSIFAKILREEERNTPSLVITRLPLLKHSENVVFEAQFQNFIW